MSIQYRYDELSRLVGAVHESGHEITYAYDAAGNRISVVVGKAAGSFPTPMTAEPSTLQNSPPAPPERLASKDMRRKPPPPEKLR